jgi:hypothetical protein
VHRATAASGERVVSKVQRTSGGGPCRRSCRTWHSCGCSWSGARAARCFQQIADLPAVFEHLSASLQRELDYELEGEALERWRRSSARSIRLACRGDHRELSSRRCCDGGGCAASRSAKAPPGDAGASRARPAGAGRFLQQVLARTVLSTPTRKTPGKTCAGLTGGWCSSDLGHWVGELDPAHPRAACC